MDTQKSEHHSDFSIDHILNRAGTSANSDNLQQSSVMLQQYSWLQCNRYYPPKIQRSHQKNATQKRHTGRHPRIPFTRQQLFILEKKFHECPYLSSEEVLELAKQLDLVDVRVKIWFQNRRARERREQTMRKEPSSEISESVPHAFINVPEGLLHSSNAVNDRQQ